MRFLIFISTILFISGCSSKVTYPQLEGKSIQYFKNQSPYSVLNKELLLNKVDMYANNIFRNLEKKNKKIQSLYYNKMLNKIYNNK